MFMRVKHRSKLEGLISGNIAVLEDKINRFLNLSFRDEDDADIILLKDSATYLLQKLQQIKQEITEFIS